MEADIGVALLVREPRGVEPTEAGRTLLHHARAVLLQMEQMQSELGEYGAGLKGHVRAAVQHLGPHRAPARGPERLPGAPSAHLGGPGGARAATTSSEALRNELGDLGIVSDAVDLAGLEASPSGEDHLVLVVPRGDALARRRRAALRDVLDREFVGLAGSSPLQELVSHNAQRLGRRLAYRVRVRHLEAVCHMVEQGVGVGIVPQAVAARCAKSMRIARIALTDDWAVRNLMVCVRRSEDLPANAQLHAAPPAGGAMTLAYLDFDYSEDTEGIGVFDAMASTAPDRAGDVDAEIALVLDWASATFRTTAARSVTAASGTTTCRPRRKPAGARSRCRSAGRGNSVRPSACASRWTVGPDFAQDSRPAMVLTGASSRTRCWPAAITSSADALSCSCSQGMTSPSRSMSSSRS